MLKALQGKTAVITGAGRGIGAAIAQKLAALGATVVISGRTLARLQHAAGQVRAAGGEGEAIACDVSDWTQVAALAERIRRQSGRVDILVNNAAVRGFGGPLHTMPPDQWDTVFNTNVRGVFHTIRAFAPLMIAAGGGDIINISSIAGKGPLPNGAAYSASKWALNGLTASVAEELRGHNIRVAVVSPGSTHTEFSPHEGKSAERMLAPDDIAHAVAMLVTSRQEAFVSEVVIRPTKKA